ncbi:MAG: phospholipid carrier-dependent glycosyltransferase [Spirulinaceae cyanobacterium SM2_1_0]|nr:phospholipid carrier-dependent glycosyltransferase [Spirulinaceae cyanobacterium SM2_1_0]
MHAIVSNRWLLSTIFALSLLSLCWNNDAISLWDQDEAAYAGFAHTMRATGDWVVPDFLWSEPHRKTPLLFWAIAVAFQFCGENEFAARLPGVMAVSGTVVAMIVLGRSLFGREVAWAAGAIASSSLLLPNLAKVALTDAPLLLAQTVAVLAFLHYLRQPRWRWLVLFWGATSLGLLAKGPPILILGGGMWLFLLIFAPERRHLWDGRLWAALALALLPLLAWGRLAWQADGGEFIRWLLDWYILDRAAGGTVFGQSGPPGYYLAVLALSFLPWLAFLPGALGQLSCEVWQRQRPALELAAWLAAGWLIYELIPSKLPAYALGAYPAIALVLARYLLADQPMVGQRAILARAGRYLFLSVAWGLAIALPLAATRWLELERGGIIAASLVAVGLAGLASAEFWALQRGRWRRGLAIAALSGPILLLLVWGSLMPALEPQHSATQRVAQAIATTTQPQTEVLFARRFDLPSLPFYIAQSGRTYQAFTSNETTALLTAFQAAPAAVAVFDDTEAVAEFQQQLQARGAAAARVETVTGWFARFGQARPYFLAYRQPPAT